MIKNRQHAWIVVAGLLGVIAVWQPIALYLVALSIFGLPHVLWELAWVRQVWGASLPRALWYTLSTVLMLQICARLAYWQQLIDSTVVGLCDLVTLALVLIVTLVLFKRVAAQRRVWFIAVAVLVPIALIVVADTPYIVAVLAMLAIAHNFTPLGLMPKSARIGEWPARRALSILFSAPLLLFFILLFVTITRPIVALPQPGELAWAQHYSLRFASALLPALVWAQCLHYVAVLHLMPRALGDSWQGLPMRALALASCGLLLSYFIADFSQARRLYAVAAGLHAWLEWPLILLALSGFALPQQTEL